MKLEVSNGEILDKLSILQLKFEKIENEEKKRNIAKELAHIKPAADLIELHNGEFPNDLYYKLYTINETLWDIEDRIRVKEKNKEFDQEFIDLARSVYYTNDQRANIKKEINTQTGSQFIEEKSYEEYE